MSPILLSYMAELRKRILFCVCLVFLVFCVLLWVSDYLHILLAWPLTRYFEAHTMIATSMLSPVLVPIKLAFTGAFLVAAPFILYQLGVFITPALYRSERILFWKILSGSILLFYSGVIFAFFIVIPGIFSVVFRWIPKGVQFMPEIAQYQNFSMQLLLWFGVLFEIPLGIYLAFRFGWVDADTLKSSRPYIIVGAFVVGMLLTPPDVISQVIVAIPLWGLFELGTLLVCYHSFRTRKNSNEISQSAQD